MTVKPRDGNSPARSGAGGVSTPSANQAASNGTRQIVCPVRPESASTVRTGPGAGASLAVIPAPSAPVVTVAIKSAAPSPSTSAAAGRLTTRSRGGDQSTVPPLPEITANSRGAGALGLTTTTKSGTPSLSRSGVASTPRVRDQS